MVKQCLNGSDESWRHWQSSGLRLVCVGRTTPAAPVAAVNVQVGAPESLIVGGVVWVRVPNSMRTDSFHYSLVPSPLHRPVSHVVIGWVVDAAKLSGAFRWAVCFHWLGYLHHVICHDPLRRFRRHFRHTHSKPSSIVRTVIEAV